MHTYSDLFNLSLFADSGSAVNITTNATTGVVNAYTGAYDTTDKANNSMNPTMKTFYNTELLENARPKLIFTQLGKKQSLPANHGETVEWRKFNTIAKALTPLTEAVIPTGKKFGMTSTNVTVLQYGDYITISDRLDLHAVDNIILGATEELGAAGGATADTLVRNVLAAGTNVIYADTLDSSGNYSATPTTRAGLSATNNKLTPDMVNKAYTWLKKQKAPYFEGNKYVAVIHPSVTYDLRSSKDWVEVHKYAATKEIFEGEIGELHGVRFIETTEAPVVAQSSSSGAPMVYLTLFFGKDAFGVVDPEGMGMEMIVKSQEQVGGPLNQFSTVGYKFESATKILYQDRMVRVESCSFYSGTDTPN